MSSKRFILTLEGVDKTFDGFKAIHDLNIMHEDSATSPYVTASIGVAIVAPRIGRSPDGAVQVADEALYSAKRSGRNCISVVDCDQVMFSTGTFRRRA